MYSCLCVLLHVILCWCRYAKTPTKAKIHLTKIITKNYHKQCIHSQFTIYNSQLYSCLCVLLHVILCWCRYAKTPTKAKIHLTKIITKNYHKQCIHSQFTIYNSQFLTHVHPTRAYRHVVQFFPYT